MRLVRETYYLVWFLIVFCFYIQEKEEEERRKKQNFEKNIKERRETYKKLNKRTKKGQPVMANQIEHLLQKIQSQT